MRRLLATGLFLLFAGTPLFGQLDKPGIFIPPTGDGFDVYIAAAMVKKNVPATVVSTPKGAHLTLKAAQVEIQRDSAKMKFAKCLLQSCANTEDRATTSVQLLDGSGAVLWSYAVERDDSSKKSMAETIAKRLKRDYFGQ
jgi:hypothetical protein